jgi:Protein of unknown function (DUF3079)
MARVALYPKHPDRVCWGCDRYCPAEELTCGNGSIRTPHPIELLGEDWIESERLRWPDGTDVAVPEDACRAYGDD